MNWVGLQRAKRLRQDREAATKIYPKPGITPLAPLCDCGCYMLLRGGPYGFFWGCSQYPKCKGIKKLQETKQ